MDNETDQEWREHMAELVRFLLQRIPSTAFIASLPLAKREDLCGLIELSRKADDDLKPSVFPSDLRFCWALHSSRSLQEVLPGTDEIHSVDELIHIAYQDQGSAIFSGLLHQTQLALLRDLLTEHGPIQKSTDAVSVIDRRDSSSRGLLCSIHPIVILIVSDKSCAQVSKVSDTVLARQRESPVEA